MTSNIGNPDVTPDPPIHNVPAADSPSGALNSGTIVAEGEFILDSIIGAVAIALGNVSVLGVKPLAFLTSWGEALETQATTALTNANAVATAQAVAIDATSSGSVHTGSPTSYTLPHTCAQLKNTELIVDVSITPLTPETYAGGTTAVYDDLGLTSLGYVNIGDGTGGWLERFHLDDPPGDTNNIVVTPPSAVQSIIVSAESYTGCSGVSGFASAATDAATQALTVQTVANGMASFAFAAATPINDVLTGATIRSLQNVANTPGGNLIVGDAHGGAAVTVTASTATGVASYGERVAETVTPSAVTTAVLGIDSGAAETIIPTGTGAASRFVIRDPSTGNLMLNSQRFRIAGANSANDIGTVGSGNGNGYGGTVVSGSYLTPHAQIDAYFASAQLMNANCFKGTWSAHTTNHPLAVQPTLGVFNAANLDPLDYALSKAAALGMKAVIPFCEQYTAKPWYVAQTGGTSGDNNEFYTRTATVNAYKAHISFVLNHVNPYTSIALKNDPTVLCWQIGNEFLAPSPMTEAQYVTWADDIVNHIKVVNAAQQLVQDGHYGPYGLASTCDIYDQHAYDQYRTVSYLESNGASCHAAGKAFFVGEFDWTDNSSHSTQWTLAQQLDHWERSSNIDGGTYWDLLAPLTNWSDGYSLKRPGTSADMVTRGDELADHALRMTGITPKTFVTDTFTDSNGTALSSHIGEAGATWDIQDSYTGVLNIQSNRLYGGTTQGRYYSSGVPASADYTVSADIYTASLLGAAGVLARAATEENACYDAYIKYTGSTAALFLDDTPNGTLSTATIPTPTVGSTHNIALQVSGTQLSVYWDGALILGPKTNTIYPAAGRAGVLHSIGGSSTTGFHIDNFSAIDA